MSSKMNDLGTIAAQTAMRAAAEWWNRNVSSVSASDAADRLVPAIRRHTKDALTQALADAKEALDAGMGSAAQATFLATMRLAGINAARECTMEVG